jgi:hypothetical protein
MNESQVTPKNFWSQVTRIQDNIDEAIFGVRTTKSILDETLDAYLSAKNVEALRE